ncbi:MAG: ferredoxin family protein [Clostridia bacterium]
MSKNKSEITIDYEWCKRCGICATFCPVNVYDLDSDNKPTVARPEACIVCRMCEKRCPDLAINVKELNNNE